MSKSNVATTKKPEENGTALMSVGGQEMTPSDFGKVLKGMKAGLEVTSKYKEWGDDAGEIIRCVPVGIAKIPKIGSQNDEKVSAIRSLSEDGEMILMADAVIVSTLFDVAEKYQNTPSGQKPELKGYEITFKGWLKSSKGQYRDFSIRPLY